MKRIRINSKNNKSLRKERVFVAMPAPHKFVRGKVGLNAGKKPQVFVAMSGGVDSSLSAALLKAARPNNFKKLFGRPTPNGFRGYDVTGVFIKVWQPDFTECVWKEDRLDAMRVCAKLGVKFLTLDLEKEYKKEVVDYMLREYKAGRTPNPDVNCNKYVKFGAFFDFAMKSGADYMATGHYARIHRVLDVQNVVDVKIGRSEQSEQAERYNKQSDRTSRTQLLVARDSNKDQSYFLWNLTQEHLSRTLFPIGDLQKTEVRKMARKFNLSVSDKKDSQGLCFIGKVDMKDFLKHYLPSKKGDVLNEEGEIIGWHEGAYFYTIGQRRGFTITEKSSEDKPYYVISKNIASNELIVSDTLLVEGVSSSKKIIISGVNWICGKLPDFNKKYKAKIRYRQPLQSCRMQAFEYGIITHNSKKTKKTKDFLKFAVIFESPQVAVSKGQSLVIYDGESCIGGGVIDNFE